MRRAIPTTRSRLAWISSVAAFAVAALSWLRRVLAQWGKRRDRRLVGGVGVLRLSR